MDSKEFVAGLQREMRSIFSQLGDRETLEAESDGQVEVTTLLKLALDSELEASELAGAWMASTPEIEAKLALAHQCGDEMRHYQLITERLTELGVDLSDFTPLADGYSPLYEYHRGLETTVERVAGAFFTSEGIAEVRNRQFIALCESVGDEKTAKLYRDVILPEEVHHHILGKELLEKFAVTAELQEKAAAAMRNTLAIADELRLLAEETKGIFALPVS